MMQQVPFAVRGYRHFTIALASLIALSVIILPLAGCSDGGQGEPNLASLSTPTDPPQSEDAQSDPNATEIAPGEQEEMAMSPEPEPEPLPDEATEGDLEPPPPTGATAQLNWEASTDPNVLGYFVHYGKQSPGEYGSCSYEKSQRVGPPPATITELDPNTPYFFAISAFGESESEEETPCSNEIIVVTPAVQG
jgi:hypothetical protein